MKLSKSLILALIIFGCLNGFSQWKINASSQWPHVPLNQLTFNQHIAQDLGALFVGSHRLAADLAYIQFLQYYGTPENEDGEEGHDGHHHSHDDSEIHDFTREGQYSRLEEFGTRILRLDPYFHEPILEVAGSLAFNQKRIGSSLDLLREAVNRDPHFHRYRLYAAAILYKNEGQDLKLIDSLIEAIRYPDCPPVLENVLGNLLKKYKRFGEAKMVYQHTIDTALDESSRETARRNLAKLLEEIGTGTNIHP